MGRHRRTDEWRTVRDHLGGGGLRRLHRPLPVPLLVPLGYKVRAAALLCATGLVFFSFLHKYQNLKIKRTTVARIFIISLY